MKADLFSGCITTRYKGKRYFYGVEFVRVALPCIRPENASGYVSIAAKEFGTVAVKQGNSGKAPPGWYFPANKRFAVKFLDFINRPTTKRGVSQRMFGGMTNRKKEAARLHTLELTPENDLDDLIEQLELDLTISKTVAAKAVPTISHKPAS